MALTTEPWKTWPVVYVVHQSTATLTDCTFTINKCTCLSCLSCTTTLNIAKACSNKCTQNFGLLAVVNEILYFSVNAYNVYMTLEIPSTVKR